MILIEECCLCSSKDFTVVYKLPGQTYVRCSQCNLVRRYEGLAANTQKQLYEEEYFTNSPSRRSDEYQYDYVSGWQWRYDQKRFGEELREITRYSASGKVLDVGAATGNFLQIARGAGYDVVGVEFSPFASAYARDRGFDVRTGALEDLSFPDESFDVVTLHHVLEHVPDPVQTLSTVHRILKRDGLMVIEVPNFASFRSRVNGPEWEDLRPGEHLHQFEPKTLTSLVERCHFRPLSLRTMSEVLWSLREPLKLLRIPDRWITGLEASISPSPAKAVTNPPAKVDKKPSLGKIVLLGVTWFLFFPLKKLYEMLGVEKRLVIFAKKTT